MQNKIAGVCGVLGLGLLTLALPALAGGGGAFGIEKSLIGLRMLQSYKDVLHKMGPPTRVYRNDETVGLIEAYDTKGNPTGGILGFSDSLAALGGGQNAGGAPGAPAGMGAGRMGMMGGPPGMPGMMGGYAGMMGGPGGRRGMMGGGPPTGMPGYPGGSAAMGGAKGRFSAGVAGMGGPGGPPGMPGFPGGRPGMMGGPPAGIGGGFGAGMSNTGAGSENIPTPRVGSYVGGETFADAGGFKWVYFYPKQQLLYEFIFNRDGRIEIILERGRSNGAPTSRGIRLGASEKAVLDTYGWPNAINDNGISFDFSYIPKSHVEFTITRHKVTGIAVFLREDQRIFEQGTPQMASQRGGMMGGLPGFPGGPPTGMAGFPGGRPGMGMMGGRPGLGTMGGPGGKPALTPGGAGGGGKGGAD